MPRYSKNDVGLISHCGNGWGWSRQTKDVYRPDEEGIPARRLGRDKNVFPCNNNCVTMKTMGIMRIQANQDTGSAAPMESYAFHIKIEEDAFEDGRKAYHAYCPALKGCHTWGHTYDEALVNIREAIELYVDDLVECGEPIPLDLEHGVIRLAAPSVVVNL